MKDVKLTVKTLMRDESAQEETTLFEYRGNYYRRDGIDFIRYREDDPKCTTIIKASADSATISRTGETRSIFKIVPGENHSNPYQTPSLTFYMTVKGKRVENRLPDGALNLYYVLATEFGDIGEREIFITLEEV